MKRVCIAALGSPHGDDRAGWEVIRLLEKQLPLARIASGEIRLTACARAAGDLLGLWKDADLAILVDAVHGDLPPGTPLRLELHPRPADLDVSAIPTLTTHGVNAVQLVELGRAIGTLPRQLILYGIEVADCTTLAGLSEPVRAALPALVQAVVQEIDTP